MTIFPYLLSAQNLTPLKVLLEKKYRKN